MKNIDMKRVRTRLLGRLVGLSITLFALAALAQPRSIQDGVYSNTQARRGGRVYRGNCATCHGPGLRGTEAGPGLRGGAFLGGWSGAPLSELLLYVRDTMPQDDPGGLSEMDYSDVLAYILQVNEFPAGDAELESDLEQIRIESTP